MFTMVTIDENDFTKRPNGDHHHHSLMAMRKAHGGNTNATATATASSPSSAHSQRFNEAFMRASVLPRKTTDGTDNDDVQDAGDNGLKLSDFIDIPSLVSDDEEDVSETESSRLGSKHAATFPGSATVEKVQRSIKDEKAGVTESSSASDDVSSTDKSAGQDSVQVAATGSGAGSGDSIIASTTENTETVDEGEVASEKAPLSLLNDALGKAQFKNERSTLMKIVVKYVAMKITNLFPPESPRTMDPNEMPLDKFLLILTSRLQLTLPTFMKGIIYLFRYMDIVYLLRYLNQSNNFINYNEMGYNIKKLIVGCFRVTLARDRAARDWSAITGLSNGEVNKIAKTMIQRLNGKLVIKNVELLRFKMEIFRFVKMVTKEA